jgi:hypothetical protein
MFRISYTTLALIIIGIIGFIIAIRAVTPEDNWICQKGVWVKHGNPTTLMPTSVCK